MADERPVVATTPGGSGNLTTIEVPLEQRGSDASSAAAHARLGGLHPAYFVALALLIVFPFVNPSQYALSLATQILVFSIFTMSLDLVLGYAGLPNFGHAAFLGLGAYATAIFSAKLGISNLAVSLIASIIIASVGAGVLGLLAMRTSGVYFLMLTLAFAQIISAVASKATGLTGGTNGLPGVKSPDLFVPGWTVRDGIPFYFLALGSAAICFFLMFRLMHSPFGRSLIGIHQNEVRMRAIGYNVGRYKLATFWISGLFASIAGVLYALFNHFISPADTGFTLSGEAVLMVLIGGEGTLVGPILGTTAYLLIQNALSSITPRWQFVLGALFVIFVLFARRGFVGVWTRFRVRHH